MLNDQLRSLPVKRCSQRTGVAVRREHGPKLTCPVRATELYKGLRSKSNMTCLRRTKHPALYCTKQMMPLTSPSHQISILPLFCIRALLALCSMLKEGPANPVAIGSGCGWASWWRRRCQSHFGFSHIQVFLQIQSQTRVQLLEVVAPVQPHLLLGFEEFHKPLMPGFLLPKGTQLITTQLPQLAVVGHSCMANFLFFRKFTLELRDFQVFRFQSGLRFATQLSQLRTCGALALLQVFELIFFLPQLRLQPLQLLLLRRHLLQRRIEPHLQVRHFPLKRLLLQFGTFGPSFLIKVFVQLGQLCLLGWKLTSQNVQLLVHRVTQVLF
mmetsp:Transcript_40455/g.94599  ORF Transcript_40455/g.94599 Transcript_40455/m.94599 type:complete len:326 (-) Transcript_40455:598-1575(-)